MTLPEVTVVLSDLHLGGGQPDPGDDHIWQGEPLRRLIDDLRESAEGRARRLELFFNGDFFEFAQANQAAYGHLSDDRWCTEAESMAKLETILTGHANVFASLRRFIDSGNAATIAAGNHDVDLAWPRVQARLRALIGSGLRFEIGQEWVERQGGLLQIGHGHQHDDANRFERWADPIRHGDWGVPHLEMCPGTLFMVKFVNRLESRYPFADNLLPVTKLVPVLLHDDKAGFASVAWLFLRLLGATDFGTLGLEGAKQVGDRLLQRLMDEPSHRAEIGAALAAAGRDATRTAWEAGPPRTSLLQRAMMELLGRIDDSEWRRLFDAPSGTPVLGEADDGVTLAALRRAAFVDGKLALRSVARDRGRDTSAQVVVMGHTHQTDEIREAGFSYLNPGCWTRYLELRPDERVTLADLEDEGRYPYALNYVRVAKGSDGQLDASLVCFERYEPRGVAKSAQPR